MARRVLHDRYFNLAKEQGYLARSAFKLLQLDQKHHLLRPGDWVLDIGCAPGSWIQVAQKQIGPKGLVVGIDLQAVTHEFNDRVRVMQGDIYEMPMEELLAAAIEIGGDAVALKRGGHKRMFDVVVSDMAPKTSGHGDALVSARLCHRVLEIVPEVLRPGGTVVMKILEGGGQLDVLRETRRRFGTTKVSKPLASRAASVETFVMGFGRKA